MEFEAEVVSEAAHGVACIDLADAVPCEGFVRSSVEERVDADGAIVVVLL